MARTVIKTKELTLYQKPQSSIVLFRYIKEGMSLQETNSLNINIRETLFKEGKLIFNYSKIHGKIYIRCVILDPKITHKQLQHLINTVVVTGTELSK
jgi:glutamate/tyrosine decarboxylase-like PLP-dependent enzyme